MLIGALLRSHCKSERACWVCRYAVVTRPVRQGRLKLALEEVLSMTVDTPTSRSALSTASHAFIPMSLTATMCHHTVVRFQLSARQQLTFGLSGLHSLGAAGANRPSSGEAMPFLRLP